MGKTVMLARSFLRAIFPSRERRDLWILGIAVRALTVIGSGAVLCGIGVWAQRFVPGWTIVMGGGLSALIIAYLLERRGRAQRRLLRTGNRTEQSPVEKGAGRAEVEHRLSAHRQALAETIGRWNGDCSQLREPSEITSARSVIAMPILMGFLVGCVCGLSTVDPTQRRRVRASANRSKPV